MENWLFFAILSAFTAGLFNYTYKIAAEKDYNISLLSIYSYIIMIFLFGTYIIFENNIQLHNIGIILFLAFFNGFFFFLSSLSRVKSMKNIESVIFFPLYKAFGPIVVTFISLFFFGENLNLQEGLGIAIGIMVPLLLITTTENRRQKNLLLGVIFVGATAILTALTSSATKEIMFQGYDWSLYLFISSLFGLLVSTISYIYGKNKKDKFNNKGFTKFAIITGILHFLSFITFTLALEGNLAIVFTINSFSILIPIILSIIFYKEHFNLLKGIVISLSILSILLFI